MAQPIDMTGKVALVTGAGSGLGRATARKLAEAGASLCIVDISAERLAETAALLGTAAVLTHQADLSDPDVCVGAVAAAVARFGRLDALCNIAGIIHMAATADMPRELYLQTIAVNLNAPWFLSQAAIPHLLEVNGAIVNCTSSPPISERPMPPPIAPARPG